MQSHLSYLDHLLTQQTLALMAFEGVLPNDEIEEWSKGEVEKAFRHVINTNVVEQDRVIRITQKGNVIAGVRRLHGEQSFIEITSWSFLPPTNLTELSEIIALIRDAFSLRGVCVFLPHGWMKEDSGVLGQRSSRGDQVHGPIFGSDKLNLRIERITHWDRYSFF